MDYTATTTNATNTITATAASNSATVKIEMNGAAHQNGTSAVWQVGENTLAIVVTDGGKTEFYTVTVTKP